MKKTIKQWGNSFIITLSKEELKMYRLKVGDIIEIPDSGLKPMQILIESDEKLIMKIKFN